MLESEELAQLLARAANGDETAVNELFSRYRKRLKQMVRLRLNRLLQGRVDDSDILQETYLEAAKRLPDYLANRAVAVLPLAETHHRGEDHRRAPPPPRG